MPLCIKKEAFFLNEWNKQRLIEPLYDLYETTQKQYWTSQSSRGDANKKKKPNKPKTVEKADEHSDILYTVSSWNWLFSSNPFYLCLNIVRPTSCFNGIWKPAALKFILEFI